MTVQTSHEIAHEVKDRFASSSLVSVMSSCISSRPMTGHDTNHPWLVTDRKESLVVRGSERAFVVKFDEVRESR